MSHPEISRRCLECGASVRADARFCPQCGKAMMKESSPAADNGAAQRSVPLTRDVNVAAASQPATPASANFEEKTGSVTESPSRNIEPSSNAAARANESAAAAVVKTAGAPEMESAPTAGANPATSVAQHESAAAASKRRPAEMVKENLRPRVEKLRDASLTVFEEASDDTGLRFVLIAVALFLLFLLFLFLNNIIR